MQAAAGGTIEAASRAIIIRSTRAGDALCGGRDFCGRASSLACEVGVSAHPLVNAERRLVYGVYVLPLNVQGRVSSPGSGNGAGPLSNAAP